MSKIPLNLITPVRIQSVSDHVAEKLEKLILDGLLSPGDQLPSEEELAAALHVGRSTVREAKQVLVTKGLIVPRGRSGAFVADPHASREVDAILRALRDPSHEEVHQVRRIVELAACQLAAELVTPKEIKRMRTNMENIEAQAEANGASPWPRFLEIHFLIVQAARNRLLSSIYELIMQSLKRNQVPFLPLIADWNKEVEAHKRLIDVLEQGDPEAMADEMSRHLENSDKYRRDLLNYQAGNEPSLMHD